jgi:hypothetical protein
MNLKQFLGLLGFLFVAAWIAFNFGYAVLCLVGEVQSRIQRAQGAPR